jgi:RimJ/RimL family protein N-acetyltransferase
MIRIKFKKLAPEKFEQFKIVSIKNYSANMATAMFISHKKAQQTAKQQFNQIIPKGINTKDHYFYGVILKNTGQNIGFLWVFLDKKSKGLYIADVFIYSKHRNKGYGTEIMHLICRKAKLLKCNQIRLHVFGNNTPAIKLYKKFGFVETNINMTLRLVK